MHVEGLSPVQRKRTVYISYKRAPPCPSYNQRTLFSGRAKQRMAEALSTVGLVLIDEDGDVVDDEWGTSWISSDQESDLDSGDDGIEVDVP